MSIFKKIRNLPIHIRKITLWAIVIIIGLGLISWWIKNFQQRLKGLQTEELKEQFQLPALEEELKGLPKIEMPNIKIPETEE